MTDIYDVADAARRWKEFPTKQNATLFENAIVEFQRPPIKATLNPRQKCVLNFIRKYIEEVGTAPIYTEIMAGTGVGSKSNVHRILTCLEARGHIRRIPGAVRAIEVL